MKLKTLEDIDWYVVGDGRQQEWAEEAYYSLKQEAIKWIKIGLDYLSKQPSMFRINKIKDKEIIFEGLNPEGFENEERMKGRIMGFILFFNITEEDLK